MGLFILVVVIVVVGIALGHLIYDILFNP